MADIVELSHPDNVELVAGAVQNWADLPAPAAAEPLLRSVVAARLAGARRCLVVGPHAPALLREVAGRVELTVAVRAIVDAAAIGEACPTARVRCGQLPDALAGLGTFDLVVALDDVTRTQSLEAEPLPWADLAGAIRAAVAPGGTLLLAVENDLGVHRLSLAENPATRDGAGDWTPLATWDATRPRTRAQLDAMVAALGLAGGVWDAHGDFRRPAALALGVGPAAPALERLLPALATRPATPAQGVAPFFTVRSLTLAGRLADHCAGWLVVAGPDAATAVPARVLAGGPDADPVVWTAAGPDAATAAHGGTTWRVGLDGPAWTLLARVIEACTANDLPALRGLLTSWRAWLAGWARDGVLPAAVADARFGNVLPGPAWAALAPAPAAVPLDEALWTALADAFDTLRAQGVRLPWPPTMHPRTQLETFGAMAGVEPPADLAPYVHPVDAGALALLSRSELIATVRRQERQLEDVWDRWTWDERRYATDRALRIARKAVTKVARDGARLLRRGEASGG